MNMDTLLKDLSLARNQALGMKIVCVQSDHTEGVELWSKSADAIEEAYKIVQAAHKMSEAMKVIQKLSE